MRRLTRRSMLRGTAATIALPWLEAMQPLLSQNAQSVAAASPQRIGFMYIPNGVILQHWHPAAGAADFLDSQSLRPLNPIRDDLVVINGLNRTYIAGEPHSQCGSCWLTSARPDAAPEGGVAIDTTLDQIIARQVGGETPFPSLELSCNSFVDNMEPKLFDAISWYGPGNDARSMNDPVAVFDRLFGTSQPYRRSVLDTVLEDAQDLKTQLGVADRRKLDEYLESVRAVEKRLHNQDLSRLALGSVESPVPDAPPVNRGEYIRLMGDLMVLAFKTDQTRVASLMVGPERWETPQLYDDVFDRPVNHHQMTHDDEYDELVARIDRFHVQQFVYVVEQLRNTPEGEGTLLDNTFLVLGSGLGDGNSHSYRDLPVVVAGRGGRAVETGRAIQCADDTPLANLWLSLANQMGLSLASYADSTNALTEFAG